MRRWLTILLPPLVVLVLSVVHLTLGAVAVRPEDIWGAFTAFDETNYSHVIIVYQRLTRLIVALYAGAALAIAGLLLQKIMQNGLVSPGTLGVNAGATSFVVLAVLLFGASGAGLFLPALLGGLVAVGLAFLVSGLLSGQGDAKLNLVLAGSMTGALFSAITTFVISIDPDSFSNLIGWLVGDIGNFDYLSLGSMAPIGFIAVVAAVLMSRAVDILVLGDEQAAVMGVDVRLIYGATLLIAVALAVTAVVVVGPIGFVGLVMPHVARIVHGEIGRVPLWLCLTGGACLLTGADILARLVMAPRVLNVGTVMGLAGGLVFLLLVLFGTRRLAR